MLIFLATLSIAAALLYPAWSVRDFRSQVEQAIADVDAVRAAAQDVRESTRSWPTPAAPGEAPAELSSLGGEGGTFDRAAYSVQWMAWQVVDSVEAPPLLPNELPSADDAPPADAPPTMLPVVHTMGSITVRSGDADLLAELQAHYAERTSFVLDTMWLLVLPERSEPARTGVLFGR
jgi:hypothetical protein